MYIKMKLKLVSRWWRGVVAMWAAEFWTSWTSWRDMGRPTTRELR